MSAKKTYAAAVAIPLAMATDTTSSENSTAVRTPESTTSSPEHDTEEHATQELVFEDSANVKERAVERQLSHCKTSIDADCDLYAYLTSPSTAPYLEPSSHDATLAYLTSRTPNLPQSSYRSTLERLISDIRALHTSIFSLAGEMSFTDWIASGASWDDLRTVMAWQVLVGVKAWELDQKTLEEWRESVVEAGVHLGVAGRLEGKLREFGEGKGGVGEVEKMEEKEVMEEMCQAE